MSRPTAADRRRLLRGVLWAVPALWLACDLLGPAARATLATGRLTAAVCNNDPEAVCEALAGGADPERAGVYSARVAGALYGLESTRHTPVPLLLFAAAQCDAPTIEALLRGAKGSMVATPERLTSALRLAVVQDNPAAVAPLLGAGAARSPSSRDAILRFAARRNKMAATRSLLACGLRLTLRPEDRPAAMYFSDFNAERLVARVTWPGWKLAPRKAGAAPKPHPATAARRRAEAEAAAGLQGGAAEPMDWR